MMRLLLRVTTMFVKKILDRKIVCNRDCFSDSRYDRFHEILKPVSDKAIAKLKGLIFGVELYIIEYVPSIAVLIHIPRAVKSNLEMNQETFAQPEYKEGLEADAVCGQCGSVNPEGTLICKMCGNNLRDQRMLRLAADQMLEAEGEPMERSQFLARALTILGLLIVLWLGINAGRIASLLTTAESYVPESAIYARPSVFWNDADSQRFTKMHRELMLHFPTESDAESARMSSAPMSNFTSGRYALYERLGTGARFVGAAIVETEGNECYYVAVLRPNIEIRGKANLLNESFITNWDEAGVALEDEFYAITGVALLQPDGSVSINGQSDVNSRRHQALAYRLGAY